MHYINHQAKRTYASMESCTHRYIFIWEIFSHGPSTKRQINRIKRREKRVGTSKENKKKKREKRKKENVPYKRIQHTLHAMDRDVAKMGEERLIILYYNR